MVVLGQQYCTEQYSKQPRRPLDARRAFVTTIHADDGYRRECGLLSHPRSRGHTHRNSFDVPDGPYTLTINSSWILIALLLIGWAAGALSFFPATSSFLPLLTRAQVLLLCTVLLLVSIWRLVARSRPSLKGKPAQGAFCAKNEVIFVVWTS